MIKFFKLILASIVLMMLGAIINAEFHIYGRNRLIPGWFLLVALWSVAYAATRKRKVFALAICSMFAFGAWQLQAPAFIEHDVNRANNTIALLGKYADKLPNKDGSSFFPIEKRKAEKYFFERRTLGARSWASWLLVHRDLEQQIAVYDRDVSSFGKVTLTAMR